MKKLIFVLLLALGAGAAQGQVKFETKSTDAVREMAIKSGKLVFIDLYASWCPPCRMMEREVFSRKDVGDFMQQRFVAAKYDTDKPTGKELMKRYGSGAIPLYLVFDTRIGSEGVHGERPEDHRRLEAQVTAAGPEHDVEPGFDIGPGHSVRRGFGFLAMKKTYP